MNITKTLEGTTLTLVPEGRLDTTTSPQLEALLATVLDNVTELVFDLSLIHI